MIHVLATALVTQRISEEISGAGVLIASKVAIGDLSFLFPGWRCPPADCQLPLRQEGAECTCSCSCLHSTLLCFLLPSSNLSFPPHNSSTFTLGKPLSICLHLYVGIAQKAITPPPPRTQTGTLGHFFSCAILPFYHFYHFSYHFFTIFSE